MLAGLDGVPRVDAAEPELVVGGGVVGLELDDPREKASRRHGVAGVEEGHGSQVAEARDEDPRRVKALERGGGFLFLPPRGSER